MKIALEDLAFAHDEFGDPLNPRTGMDTTELQNSLDAFGQVEPIIVSPPNDGGARIVYSGHRRVVAARALKWKVIEAVERLGMPDDNDIRAAMLASHAREAHDPLRVAAAVRYRSEHDDFKLKSAKFTEIDLKRNIQDSDISYNNVIQSLNKLADSLSSNSNLTDSQKFQLNFNKDEEI